MDSFQNVTKDQTILYILSILHGDDGDDGDDDDDDDVIISHITSLFNSKC